LRRGIRIGIIARHDADDAWQIARARFPENRRGQLAHSFALSTSDSIWHNHLSELVSSASKQSNPYWLWPFQNYGSFCPYLVGDYDTVADEISRCIGLGYFTNVLDIPREAGDLEATNVVFSLALEKALAQRSKRR
jgi:alkanesulfonate monooxygenase